MSPSATVPPTPLDSQSVRQTVHNTISHCQEFYLLAGCELKG